MKNRDVRAITTILSGTIIIVSIAILTINGTFDLSTMIWLCSLTFVCDSVSLALIVFQDKGAVAMNPKINANDHIGNAYADGVKQDNEDTREYSGLVGYKGIIIQMLSNGKAIYLSPTAESRFGYESICICNNNKLKHVFDPACSCGWYSFKTIEPAQRYVGGSKMTVAETKPLGQFVEYDSGYRSERQRVVAIIFDECNVTRCQNKASNAAQFSKKNVVVGVCDIHKNHNDYERAWTFPEFAQLLPQPEQQGRVATEVLVA